MKGSTPGRDALLGWVVPAVVGCIRPCGIALDQVINKSSPNLDGSAFIFFTSIRPVGAKRLEGGR